MLTLLALLLTVQLPVVEGRASVIDGDTLEIHGERIRLWGVDAPEGRQTCTRAGASWRCGQEAAAVLESYVKDQVVRCVPEGRRDRYRRIVARCEFSVPNMDRAGRIFSYSRHDLAGAMVTAGWAIDYPMFSRGAYADEEAVARDHLAGLWTGEFDKPWDWRATRRRRS